MKKILFLVLCVALTGNLYAQQEDDAVRDDRTASSSDEGLLRFGAFLAPNISWMHPTTSKSDDGNYFVTSKGSRVGFTWGLMGEYYFAPNYGITFGFNLNNTGGKIATSVNSHNVDTTAPNTVIKTNFTYKLQYLEIPVSLKLRSDEIGNGLRIFGQVGISLAITTSKKANYDVAYKNVYGISDDVSGSNEKLQGTLAVSPLLVEMNLGAGIEYNITDKIIFYSGLFFNNAFLPDVTNPQNYTLGYTGSFKDGNTRVNDIALRVGIFF